MVESDLKLVQMEAQKTIVDIPKMIQTHGISGSKSQLLKFFVYNYPLKERASRICGSSIF